MWGGGVGGGGVEHILFCYELKCIAFRGRSRGGGGPGGPDPPPFWGTHKLHKEGKNVARVHGKTPHFST